MSEEARIPTNLRTLKILEILGESDEAMTATEINDRLGLPKQTVHRLCTTLESEGYITRVGSSKRFFPSSKLREIGSGLLFASHSHILRRQILKGIATQVKETVNYAAPVVTGMSYIDRVETDWPFRIQLPVGTSVPFHCTASGKTFMASLPPKARKAFVKGLFLNRLTDSTHVTEESLLEDLAGVARRGYAIDDEEFMDGMIAIAVPVKDEHGRFCASLALHGPMQRLTIEQALDRKEALLNGSHKLTSALFSQDGLNQ